MNSESRRITEAQQVLNSADLIYTADQIHSAINRLAESINRELGDRNEPVIVLPVMNGGLVLCGHLFTRLNFPVLLDYLHATRYRDETSGADLHWKAKPQQTLKNKTVLVIDDILDEGYTLSAVLDYCRQQEVAQVYSVVLVEKEHARSKAAVKADFTGLYVNDRYVFGFGMDYKGYHRNLNGIYAVSGLENEAEINES